MTNKITPQELIKLVKEEAKYLKNGLHQKYYLLLEKPVNILQHYL
jgi:hypothetical protein